MDHESELERIRRDNAREAELQAAVAEIDAAQYEQAKDDPGARPNLADNARVLAENAAKARKRADAAHALAGTKPKDFEDDISRDLNNRLESIQRMILMLEDRVANPEAYSTESNFAQEQSWGLVESKAAVDAIEKRLAPKKGAKGK